MVEWSSGSKSVQSSATTTSGRLPMTNGTQEAKSFQTSTPVLEKNRSTCLTACFPLSSFATARARPSAPTASWAPCRAPTVASASEATRFAWRSQSKIEETKSCTRRGRMARVRMAQHDDLNPADRLQLRPSHDRGDEGIGPVPSDIVHLLRHASGWARPAPGRPLEEAAGVVLVPERLSVRIRDG